MNLQKLGNYPMQAIRGAVAYGMIYQENKTSLGKYTASESWRDLKYRSPVYSSIPEWLERVTREEKLDAEKRFSDKRNISLTAMVND